MLILYTDAAVKPENKEIMKREVKKATGLDCIVLDCGLRLEELRLKEEQPLWKRLPWPFKGKNRRCP